MTTRSIFRAAIGALLALCLASPVLAASRDEYIGKKSLLRFVPADTPYLFATGEPLDDKFLDAIEPHADKILDAYHDMLVVALDENEDNKEGSEALRSVVLELEPLFSIKGLRDAGIERDSQMALYGNGLLPVLRVEVADRKAFENTLLKIEKAAGEPMVQASIDDQPYRYVGDDSVNVIIGYFDGTMVLTVMPADFDEDQKRQLLGLKLPGKSIAATATVPDFLDKYGYTSNYFGFVDTLRLADSFLSSPADLDAALFQKMEFDSDMFSDVCKKEIREVAGIAPRLVFGYNEISLERMTGSLMVELRKDLADGLKGISALVPGLGQDQGGVLSLGASVNLQALMSFYSARLDAMEADPFECEYFAELQASVPEQREALQKPLPPIAYGIRGANLVLQTLDIEAFAAGTPPDPSTVDASVVVAMQDTAALVAAGMMFSPELAALNLQPDGKAVALELPQLQAMAIEAFAAMKPDALSVAVGSAAESQVTRTLEAASATPPPSFAMAMDAGKYYELVALGLEAEPAEPAEGEEAPKPPSPEMIEATQRILRASADLYERMFFALRFTAEGALVDTWVTFKDL